MREGVDSSRVTCLIIEVNRAARDVLARDDVASTDRADGRSRRLRRVCFAVGHRNLLDRAAGFFVLRRVQESQRICTLLGLAWLVANSCSFLVGRDGDAGCG